MRLPPFAALVLLLCTTSRSAAARPNIVFILTDDQAPWAVGVSGNEQAVTPNLDRLFREGAYLKNAFCVTPVCSPSRVSILASRYGAECGINDWINPKVEPELGLDAATPAWPRLLEAAGYRTALIGKWHLGSTDRFHPREFGYQYFTGFRGGGIPVKDPTLEKDGRPQQLTGLTVDLLTDEALRFIRESAAQPFCLSLHYRSPHAPWLPVAEEDAAPYLNRTLDLPQPNHPGLNRERTERMLREYLASVRGVDRNVGRLLALLEELKLADNTVVIFTSDHGYNLGHNGIWHKGNGHWALTEPPPARPNIPRGQRPNMFDNSLRVPAAVRWPGVVPAGAEVTHTITHLDWFPTLLAMAGVELPKELKVRGRNVLSILRGETPADWNNELYAHYSTHHQTQTHMRAYRTAQWKLVRDYLNPERDEFFDLVNDPAETTNLLPDARPEVQAAVAALQQKLAAQMRSVGDEVFALPPEPADASP